MTARLFTVVAVLFALLAPRVLRAQTAVLISDATYAEVDKFFRENDPLPEPPLARVAFASYLEAARAYKRQDFAKCVRVLDALWAEFPVGSDKWHAVSQPIQVISLSRPQCYYALLMLDEASRWKLNPLSKTVTPHNIVFSVDLVGRATGKEPRTLQELKDGTAPVVTHRLSPLLIADNFKLVRDCTWLLPEYVLAMTKGKLKVNYQYNYHPEIEVNLNVYFDKTFFSRPGPDFYKVQQLLDSKQTHLPAWRWVIYPSLAPDRFSDFQKAEVITGGGVSGLQSHSPCWFIDDAWLLRRPPHQGQGAYTPIEREAYMPCWQHHEFFHHVAATYPELELEKTSHQWFDRSQWPKDFEGIFEPDYFREALHKRLQPLAKPPLHVGLRYDQPPASFWLKFDYAIISGKYEHQPATDPWHSGTIAYVGKDNNGNHVFRWTNAAKVNWYLYLNIDKGILTTGPDNPFYTKYSEPNMHEFRLIVSRDADGNFLPQIDGYEYANLFHKKL